MNNNQNERELKYNFVFFFVHEDYRKAIIGSSNEYMHVYDWTFGKTSIGKFISRLYWSYSLRCRIKLPFKKLFFKRMYEQKFDSDKALCFVYLSANSIRFDDGWCDYVRKRDSRNKQVIFHTDLISKKIHWDYAELKNKMDLCITYDENEAKEYGIKMLSCGLGYNKPIPRDTTGTYDYDVYYLAAIKDRYDEIIKVYQRFHMLGARCCFLLSGVPADKQIELEGVTYIANISYEDNIRLLNRSKCVLEIKQGKSSGNITLRHIEAVAYQKRILTNSHVENFNYYNEGQLMVFDDSDEINENFIKAPMNENDYPPAVDLDPVKRLFAIQDLLEHEKNE